MFKPFKPPSLLKKVTSPHNVHTDQPPPRKKQRLSPEVYDENGGVKRGPTAIVRKVPPSVTPLSESNSSNASAPPQSQGHVVYYTALWRKYTNKKHKTWDGDGVVKVSSGYAYLEDASGKAMGRASCPGPLLPESTFSIGGKEVQIDCLLSREEYLSQKPTTNDDAAETVKPTVLHKSSQANALRHTVAKSGSDPKDDVPAKGKPAQKYKTYKKSRPDDREEGAEKPQRPAAPKSMATQARYRNPVLETTVFPKQAGSEPKPRHDPYAAGALIMRRPRARDVPKGKQIVDVVIDPLLSKHLRDHQREGVKFLYECVMGMRGSGDGAILADEMGLGKTLQTITLLWTLLKQSPIFETQPVIKKALIVCPATLLNNWKKEFRKWLGNERIGVFVFDDARKRITDFTRGRTYSVLIIGYEKLRTNIDDLQKGHGIDIVIADEGHRLKTQQNKAGVALRSLETTKRIILSGTPIQNDLSEFFSMVEFVNPGALGTAKAFVKQFETPIEKSRQPEATEDAVEKGTARGEELAELTSAFIFRRTVDVLAKYLPPKTEYVLLCRPTCAQANVYHEVLNSARFQSALNSADGRAHLQLIMLLRKVCNSPRLLNIDPAAQTNEDSLAASVAASLPSRLLKADSTKIRFLDSLLYTLHQRTTEKIVLASNFTTTLDILGNLLTSLSLPFLRLDGSVLAGQRQELVDTFNRTPASSCFAFLISARAGGAGLNLIGASRLVLFDVDWNPATDAQVLARIHRDGQKRPCVVYRLLMAGALDEKIWQRQVTKLGLADSVMERMAGTSSFTREELKDLFQLDERAVCQTHELIGCPCDGKGVLDSGTTTKIPGTPDETIETDHLFVKKEKDDSNVGEEDDLDDAPLLPKLRPASELDIDAQEHDIVRRRAEKRNKQQATNMQSLMSYTHIDVSQLGDNQEAEDVDALIHDDILLNVLKDEGNTVRFMFSRTSDPAKIEPS